MDLIRLGIPHRLRYSIARTLVLPDTLFVAISYPTGQWHALGATRNHDSELHRAGGGLRALDGLASHAAAGRVGAQNYWGGRRDTVDSLGLRGRIGMELAFIVSGVVFITVIVTAIAAYLLNKLNRS